MSALACTHNLGVMAEELKQSVAWRTYRVRLDKHTRSRSQTPVAPDSKSGMRWAFGVTKVKPVEHGGVERAEEPKS
jgi:hypothetical protein